MWERKYRNPVSDKTNRSLYDIRKKMIQRCTDPSFERYKDYGGRGISICQEWLEDFDLFADWAKDNGYQKGLTIDRIDNDGDYEPSNCRWITKKEQNRNKRTNLLVTYKGITKSLKDWCEELGLKYDATHNRITKGWDVETAFTAPLTSEYESIASKCRKRNLNPQIVYDRIWRLGWSEERALNTPAHPKGWHSKVTFGEAECKVCGKNFTKNNTRQVYCSEKCHRDSKKAWFKAKVKSGNELLQTQTVPLS